MIKYYFFGLFILTSNLIVAQSGKIIGRVINANSGLPMASATLLLIEQSKVEIADQNGDFTFTKLNVGTYSIKCTYAGYKEKIIDEIIVKDKDNTNIVISLEQKRSLDEIVITTKKSARVESVAAILIAQKNSASVSDGISAESIRKTPDRSSSDVIKRVSGASIQDDRFAILRGLNDRYNAAYINGAPLPSTESDRKAFAFDIFPSAILDNLVIYKTATPDKSLDFAGGIIDITTKSISPKNFTTISFSLGYNNLITGKNRFSPDIKGSKDWLGIDDGTRAIPNGIPNAREMSVSTFLQKSEYAKLFGNYKWGLNQSNTAPDFNFQITKGFNQERNQKEFLGALFSINYKKGYTFNEGERNTVGGSNGAFKDSVYNDEVVVAALANISVKINNRNNFSWKNNLSINTDNKLIKRVGVPDLDGDPERILRDAVRWFTSNQIFSSQIIGEHLVSTFKTKINWMGAYTNVKRELPNYARTTYAGDKTSLGSAFIPDVPNQLLGSGSMFFANTDENIKSIKADVSQPYTLLNNTQNLLKIGAGYQVRQREFTSRVLGFAPYKQGDVQFDYSVNELPESQIFLPQNLGKMKNGLGGFLLNDGTTSNSDYSASSEIKHAYIMDDQRFLKKCRLIFGIRMESFNQKLNSPSASVGLPPITIDSTVIDFLPSVNFVYALTPKINVRLSYTQTINRPEFRELAPFVFYDYQAQYSISGSVNLRRAKITNYDFRLELFPGKAQLFSISAFYKDFIDPIEIVFVPGIAGQAAYLNSQSAKVYGAEAEIRTLVSSIFGVSNERSVLTKFTLSANAAYIKSAVNLPFIDGTGTVSRLATDRPLQGQSPYLINASVSFNDEKTGISSTLSANKVGDRLAVGGVKNESFDIYEKARTVVDFQVAKFFLLNKLEIKFNARDILAQNISTYYDNDSSKSFNSETDIYFGTYLAPKVFSLSATYKF